MTITRPGAQRSTTSPGQGSPPSSTRRLQPLRAECGHRRRGLSQHVDLFADQQGVGVSGEPATDSGTTTSGPRRVARPRSPTPRSRRHRSGTASTPVPPAGAGAKTPPNGPDCGGRRPAPWVHRWCPRCRSGRQCRLPPVPAPRCRGWLSTAGSLISMTAKPHPSSRVPPDLAVVIAAIGAASESMNSIRADGASRVRSADRPPRSSSTASIATIAWAERSNSSATHCTRAHTLAGQQVRQPVSGLIQLAVASASGPRS